MLPNYSVNFFKTYYTTIEYEIKKISMHTYIKLKVTNVAVCS